MTPITKTLLGLGTAGLIVAGSQGLTSQEPSSVQIVPVKQIETPSTKSIPVQKQPIEIEEKEEVKIEKAEPKCHPSYSGCLNPNASDYDCSGGSGNGPLYTGKVQVLGYDEYDLDRDGDGWGCE